MTPLESSHSPLTSSPSFEVEDDVAPALVADLFLLLDKTLRSRRLYHATNPAYLNFLSQLQAAFAGLWDHTSSLSISVDEAGFHWKEQVFTIGEGRDSLPFFFYKDGIRYFAFLPGFEDELPVFLEVLTGARQRDQSGDDLVTLLWEQQFTGFQYSYVDVLGDELDLPEQPTEPRFGAIDLDRVLADASGVDGEPARPSEQRPDIVMPGFAETLYFLGDAELDALRKEVELELARDMKTDVLNALFDRIEDPVPERQREIVAILRQLTPSFLALGDFATASTILSELLAAGDRPGGLDAEAAADVQRIFDELSDPGVVEQLIVALENSILDPDGEELGVFLSHLGPRALPILIRTAANTDASTLQNRLERAVEGIGRENQDAVIELLSLEEPLVVEGAARLIGRLAVAGAAAPVAALLARPEPAIRLAAVEALVAIHSGTALEALLRGLDDGAREVRVAAARGIAKLRYVPARARLEQAILGKGIRDADLTEKIAFFEAYGAVATPESVSLLDDLLNGKDLLRRHKPPELRACAAMALGHVGTPAARSSLERARAEQNPLVRNAVSRALRKESAA
ncbi:MAG TPA: HEAT repeat domain-containing protein [Longimicrobiales bacterium]|nr:HEAT repeat domain-containing protein [Longimicrobiales bacterium]